MKYFITGMLLLIASFASSQIVNIPDPALKQWLLNYQNPYPGFTIDTNGDGEIDVNEASIPNNLWIEVPVHDYTGLDAFTNLDTVLLRNQGALNINPGHLTGVKFIQISGDFTHANLDFTGCDSLVKLYFYMVSGYSPSVRINSVNLNGLPYLKDIELIDVYIDTLTAINCIGLEQLYSEYNSGIYKLINVTGCTNLITLSLDGGTDIKTLDLSSCTSLDNLLLNPTRYLESLNIKNGRLMRYIDLGTVTPINPELHVCADDFEIDTVTTQLHRYWPYVLSNQIIHVSDYCTFFPVGSYNTISGTTRLDMNNNGCGVGDAAVIAMPVKITDASGASMVHYTDNNGTYAHYCQSGNFTISPYFPYPYFNIAPTSAAVNFPAANSSIDTENFCITPNGTHNDLAVTLLPITPARFNQNKYKLVYKNRGTTTLSGNVQVNFDNSKMSFTSASVTPGSQSSGQITWNYNNLLPFESRTIDMQFLLFVPPTNNIGDTLIFLANINPTAGDETPGDNSFILTQGVIGGYDPNDKECLQGSKLGIADIGKPLDYIIRFQNVGNDTAFNIVIADTLSNKLDWNSLEITSTSHPCDIKQKNGILECYFKDINLPYQAINDAGSNGFVAFKIKTKNNLVIGDSINNKADIYFDFNQPVTTNMAITIVSPTSSTPVKLEYFSLTSKNETNLLTWKAPSTTGTTNFGIERSNDGIHFNNLGNITASVDRCQLPFNFTDEKPFDGKTYYRLNIKDADGNAFYSKVLVAGRTKSGLSINAVVSDRNNTTVYIDASKEQNIQMKIIAADGRLMYNQNKTIEAGNSTVNLQLKNLATGIYTLIIYSNEGEVITKRFVK